MDDLDIDYDIPAEMPDHRIDPEGDADRRNWHARMAGRYRRELSEQVAAFDIEIRRLTDERDMLAAEYQRRIDYHFAPLEAHHRMLLAERGKDAPRTIRMPYGVSKLTVPKSERIDIDDYAQVLEWVEQNHPDHVKVVRSVNVTAVRSIGQIADGGRVVDPLTGELVPGVSAKLPEPTWKLDTDGNEP